mmetsp:Transcript_38944/g.110275  ORF Transcript_38944/g.110275 Transcript_38944/m.110275 type:complete len:115 (-) Transcript_38944:538-882(-)
MLEADFNEDFEEAFCCAVPLRRDCKALLFHITDSPTTRLFELTILPRSGGAVPTPKDIPLGKPARGGEGEWIAGRLVDTALRVDPPTSAKFFRLTSLLSGLSQRDPFFGPSKIP